MSAPAVLITVGLIAIAYPLGMRALLDVAQPMRLKMADLGNEILSDEAVPERDRKAVASMMDDAFEWRFMIFAMSKVPQYALARLRGKPLGDPFFHIENHESRAKVKKMVEYFTLSTAVANPFFFTIVCIQILLLVPAIRSLTGFRHEPGKIRDVAQRVVAKAECAFAHVH